MASRLEIARALAQLKTAPGYRDYVSTLSSTREAAVQRVIDCDNGDLLEARAELRVIDAILTDITRNAP